MITVLYEKESQILQFAASELKKYLEECRKEESQ